MTKEQNFSLWSRDFILICMANFFYFGSFYFLIPTMPQYVAILGGSPEQVGLVMGAFTAAAVVVRPYFGQNADRRGRKLFMLLGSGFFIFFPILYSLMASIAPLYLARVLHGFAHASFLAASAAYIADMAPPHRRGEVIGIYGTSNVVAMALFPAIGTAVVKGPGDFPFLFTLSALSAAAAFLCVVFLRDILPQGSRDLPPGRTLQVGLRRPVLVPSLTLFAGATSYGAIVTFLPLFAPQRGLKDFGLFFTVYAASTILSRVVVGRLSDRIGRRKVILPFMAVLAVGVGLLPSLYSMAMLALIALFIGFGFGAFMPTLNALVVDHTPPRERGSALGFFTSFMDVGITAGAMGLGFIGGSLGYPLMFYVGAVLIVTGLLFFAAAMKPEQAARGIGG
jgi:MFS family permease